MPRFAMAQDIGTDKEIESIDSLIANVQLDIAQRKTDSLYLHLNINSLGERKKHKSRLLELRYQQARILDKQEERPNKPLGILLEIVDDAEADRLHVLSYRIYLLIALCYEKGGNLNMTGRYLDKANAVYKANRLENLYSTYCIRQSSFCRHTGQQDSMVYYAEKALEYATKYNNLPDLMDANLLLAFIAKKNKNYAAALERYELLLSYYQQRGDTFAILYSLINIQVVYLDLKNAQKALTYSDSTMQLLRQNGSENAHIYRMRSDIYEALGKTDSAFHYFILYHDSYKSSEEAEESRKIHKLAEQYQSDKKEATIKTKNQQVVLISSLLIVIVGASVLIIRKNRQINRQNKIISTQVIDLSKTLEHKQILLSELQHRVKNNLQHVISILEIQKESVDFNNIEELIRGNQNRIHSMALLHKKLNVTDNANDVELNRYIIELSELVKESYDSNSKNVHLNVFVDVEKISLEKALPIGLIIVELVSNSMKHAFKKQNEGRINIEITKEDRGNLLYYSDNGIGFDFHQTSTKGLGQEIIKGLADQLSGIAEAKSSNGFELWIRFKP